MVKLIARPNTERIENLFHFIGHLQCEHHSIRNRSRSDGAARTCSLHGFRCTGGCSSRSCFSQAFQREPLAPKALMITGVTVGDATGAPAEEDFGRPTGAFAPIPAGQRGGVDAASKSNSSNETAPGPMVARPTRPAMGCGSLPLTSGLSFQRATIDGPDAVIDRVPHSCVSSAFP